MQFEFSNISKSKIDLSKAKLSSIIENSPYGICFTTINGEFLYTNRYYQEMVGYSDEELLQMRFFDLTYHEDLDKNKELIKNAVEELSTAKFQKRYVTKQNKTIHVRIIVKATINEQEDKFLIALAEDITKLVDYKLKMEQAELNLVRSQRMNAISELSSSLAHDFNNILNIILGYTELFQLEVGDNPQLMEYIKDIEQAAKRATSITTKLLMTTSQDVYDKKLVDVYDIVMGLKTTFKTIAGDQIDIIYDLKEDCIVFADETQLEQVLFNLVINSRDAIKGDGQIKILLKRSNSTVYDLTDYVVLTIHDSGSGIAEKDLPYIFEPFYTTKQASRGTGMGLSSVYGIVKNLNGKIDVQTQFGPEFTHTWTEFKIYLPAMKHKDSFKSTSKVQKIIPEKAEIVPKQVLIVDDNVDVLKMLKKNLELYHEVDYVADASKIEIDKLGKFDIIITDISMPKLDGSGLIKKIRQKYDKLPVLFISGYTDKKISKELKHEQTQYMKKPVLIKDLVGKIEQMTSTD